MGDSISQNSFNFDSLIGLPVESPKLHLVQTQPQKHCTKCKKPKDLDQFIKRKDAKSGYGSFCKECRNARETKRRRKVRDAIVQERINSIPPEELELRKTHKCCSHCKKWLPFDKFGANPRNKDGLFSWCYSCVNNNSKKHRSPFRSRSHKLRYHYGITPEQYDQMLEEQNGVCAVCKMPETQISAKTGKVQPLSIDHNHDTGQVRALLCSVCNAAYGYLKEDPERILGLLAYHQKWHPEP